MTPEQQNALQAFQNATGFPSFHATQLGPTLPTAYLIEFIWPRTPTPITYQVVIMPSGEFV